MSEPGDCSNTFVSEAESKSSGSSQHYEEDAVRWRADAPRLCNGSESDADWASEKATTKDDGRANDDGYTAFELDVVSRLRAIHEKLDRHCDKVDTQISDMRLTRKTSLRRFSSPNLPNLPNLTFSSPRASVFSSGPSKWLPSGFLGNAKILSGSRRSSSASTSGSRRASGAKKSPAAQALEDVLEMEMDSPMPAPDGSSSLQIEPQLPEGEPLWSALRPGREGRRTQNMPQTRSTQIMMPQGEVASTTLAPRQTLGTGGVGGGVGGGGGADNRKSLDPVAVAEEMARAIQVASRSARNEHMEMAWKFFDDSYSSEAASAFSKLMKFLILLCILITFLQTMEPSPIPVLTGAVFETCFDCLFSAEIILRFVLCPRKCSFFLGFCNWIDAFSILTLILRADMGFQVGVAEKDSASFKFLLCLVPVVRILKMLRHFQTLQILIGAFVLAAEALPVLLYMLLVIILSSSSMIYIVEPRDNIPTLATAVWLAIVTTTTVGYGDVVPETSAGCTILAILSVISYLFMAMPLGIIGSAFNITWSNRDIILLTQRLRQRLFQWGYTPEDLLVLFKFMDSDDDGALTLDDFERLMRHMRIGLSKERVAQLFENFDEDGNGMVEFDEFVHVFFPTSLGAVFKDMEQRSAGSCTSPPGGVRSASNSSCLPPGQRGASK